MLLPGEARQRKKDDLLAKILRYKHLYLLSIKKGLFCLNRLTMEILLKHIRETTGKTHKCKNHLCKNSIQFLCAGCYHATYCGNECQMQDWQSHQFQCIRGGVKKEEEEGTLLLDLLQPASRDVWSIIYNYLTLKDVKNLRLAQRIVDQLIRKSYFQKFTVKLTPELFDESNIEVQKIFPFITKVRDTSDGRLSLQLYKTKTQEDDPLQSVNFFWPPHYKLDWNSISQLRSITSLNLHSKKLTSIPDSLGQLKNLMYLELSNNMLTNIPEFIAQLENLTNLQLEHNKLTSIPEWIGKLTNLIVLNCFDNQITKVPDSISYLRNLIVLKLNFNQLKSIPDSIGQLKNLTELKVGFNQLTSVPESIGQLRNLNNLDLDSNRFSNATKQHIKNIMSFVPKLNI